MDGMGWDGVKGRGLVWGGGSRGDGFGDDDR